MPTKTYPEWDKYLCGKYAWKLYSSGKWSWLYIPTVKIGNYYLFCVHYWPCIPLIASCLSAHLILMKVLCCCLVAKSCPTLLQPHAVAYQGPLSMGFSRQEYWSRLPFPSPGDLPDPGIESKLPALAYGFFTPESPGKPESCLRWVLFYALFYLWGHWGAEWSP